MSSNASSRSSHRTRNASLRTSLSLRSHSLINRKENDDAMQKLRKKEKMLNSFLPKKVLDDLQESMHSKSFCLDISSGSDELLEDSKSRGAMRPTTLQTIQSESNIPKPRLNSTVLYSKEANNVSIILADIVGFSRIAEEISPSDVMMMLQDLFYRFDSICKNHHVLKLDTIGDAYFCASGLLREENDGIVDMSTCNGLRCGLGGGSRYEQKLQMKEMHRQEEYTKACAVRALAVAEEMIKEARKVEVPNTNNREEKEYLSVRVGIHIGNVSYGILCQNSPKLMCVGNAVNIAEQMEKTSLPNMIHMSKDFHDISNTIKSNSHSTNVVGEKESSCKYSKRMCIENMGEVETWFLDPLVESKPKGK